MGDELKARGGRLWLKWLAGVVLVVLVTVGIAVTVLMRRAEPILRALIVERLEAAFHARVELDSFHFSIASGLEAEGKGLRIWPPADVADAAVSAGSGQRKPLIDLAQFKFHAPLEYKPGVPIQIAKLELKGLVVDVPARPQVAQKAEGSERRNVATQAGAGFVQFELDSVDCKNAKLTMETNKPGKLPMEFDIDHLLLTHVSSTAAMDFDAELVNPTPKGRVITKGKFGPWVVEDPGESAVEGSYKFENADLGTIKGIGGTLNSTGNFKGALRELEVDGEVGVPKFMLASFGTAMPLDANFHARVDGTNGDTWLDPVDATLGQSHLTVRGDVVRVPGSGHQITLAVNVDRARIEDFLRLASHTGSAMLTGNVKVKANVDLGPGKESVEKKINMKGQFSLDNARFSSANVQEKVGELSMRGEGRPQDAKSPAAGAVRSTMQGDFSMAAGVVSLPGLVYTVPGAEIDLAGTYGVVNGNLAFKGNAKIQATVSQMVGGWVGALLKPADRYFKKDGAGTEIPIHVDGTREDPNFGIDLKKMKTTSPQRPGEQ